jgi:TP901 family phage tail tape measure protein
VADVAALTVSILGTQTVTPAANAAVSALGSVESAASRVGASMVNVAANIAKVTAATVALGAGAAAAGLGNAVKVAADFESQLSAIAAVSSKAEVAAVGGMKAMSDVALQLGKDTAFSATQAAAGMEEMVKAGVSLTDVMGGGAKAALDLAAAGALEVSEAATIASNAMNAFALSGKDLPAIADTLANAANASATDVHQLGLGLASVGAVAHTVGLSFEDTTTAIAEFAQMGLKGSDAGTSFKTMLLKLSGDGKPAISMMKELGIITADGANQFFDAEGKVKSFAEISGVLQTAMKGLTKEQQINALQTMFGTDAIRAAAIAAEKGAEGANALTQAQKEVGGAAAVAKERLNNLKGAMEALGGSWEVIRIKIGTPFLPILTKGVQALTKALNDAEPTISAFAEKMAAGLDALIARATTAAPRLMAFGAGLVTFGRNVVTLAQAQLPRLLDAFEKLRGFVMDGGLASGAGGLVGGLVGAFKDIEPVVMSVGKQIVTNITETFNFLTTRVIPPLVSIIQQVGTVLERTLLPAAAATGATMRGIFGDTLDWLAKTVMPPFLSIVEQTANFWTQVMLPTIPSVAQALRTTLGETVQWLATDVWPKLRVAAEAAWTFISGTIVPAIPGLVRQLRDLLGGALTWLAETGWPALVKGATAAWTFLQDNVIPVVRDTYDWLKVKLPEAINTVVSTFETIKGKVGPIVEAALNGDIAGAIKNLGTAFAEFATLAMGWLGEQVSQIKWDQVWAQAVDVATALGTYLLGLAVDFATWLGEQVSKIPWASVWQRVVDAAAALARYLSLQAVDFATWLGAEVAKIPWPTVWANVKLTAQQVVDAVAAAASGLDAALTTWLQKQIETINWKGLGDSTGQFLGAMFVGAVTGGDGGGLKPETVRKALYDFFVGVFAGLWESLKAPIQKGFMDLLNSLTPTRPSWWPTAVPWPFGPQAGSGQQFPVGAGAASPGGQPGAPGRSTASPLSMQTGAFANNEERIAYVRAAYAAQGHDPDTAETVARREGAGPAGPIGDNGTSFGAMQLHVGGGLGDTFQQETGLDPRDPNNERATIDWAARHLAQTGWSPYKGAAAAGVGNRQGINTQTPVPMPQGGPSGGGGEGMVTYRDEWGNEYTVTESQFQQRQQVANGTNPVSIVGRTAAQVGEATKPQTVNMGNFGQTAAIGNQWEIPGLSPQAAAAACGPAAAMLFLQATGRTPNSQEAMEIASKNGWTPGQGMTRGPAGFKGMLSDMGIDYATLPNTGAAAAQSVQSGHLTAISTGGGNVPLDAGHYFVAQGFNPETGEFDLGETGGGAGNALKGGSRYMTAEQITALAGPINGVIQLLGQVPPAADAAAASMTPMADATTAVGDASTASTPPITDLAAATTTLPPAMEAAAEGTTAAGQVMADGTAVMGEQVQANFDLMREGTITAVTDMGGQILTSVTDTAGTTVQTWTDLAGNVTSQTATLASGVTLSMADMGVQTTASVNEMAGTITTTMTDTAGNAVTTVSDMSGQVIGQYATMQTTAGSAVTQLAATANQQFGDMAKSAEQVPPSVNQVNESFSSVEAPDAGPVVDAFGEMADAADDAAKAAKKAAEAIKDITQAEKGGSKGNSKEFAKKASGGWTQGLTLVGEEGPEFISPQRPMYVTDAPTTRQMQGGGTDNTALVAALNRLTASLSRPTLNVYGAGTEDVVRQVVPILKQMERDDMNLEGLR